MNSVIVSRHQAAIAFIRRESAAFRDAPVLAVATADDVTGRVVAGNLPLHLAALAAEIWAVEFAGDPPRGSEYDLAAMDAAGARLQRYRVAALEAPRVVAEDTVLREYCSTNGRWGVRVVGHPEYKDVANYSDWAGYRYDRIGSRDGFEYVRLSPDALTTIISDYDSSFVTVSGDGEVVVEVGLQSGRTVTLCNVRPGALVMHVGYRGRSAYTDQVQADGTLAPAPPSVLFAAGWEQP